MVFDIGIIVTIVYFLRSLERDGVVEKFFKLSGAQEQELFLFVHERSHCYIVRCNRPLNGVLYVGFDPNRMITFGKIEREEKGARSVRFRILPLIVICRACET